MKALPILMACALSSAAAAGGLDQSRYLAPILDPAPVFSWTGLSLGASVGVVSYEDRLSGPTLSDVSRPAGGLAGASVGYAVQTGDIVTGIETDLAYSSANRSTTIGSTIHAASLESFGSTRLRLGYAFDRTLVYATGGVAYAVTHTREATGASYAGNWSLRPGWAIGAGVEYAVTPEWSVRAEGLYAGLGLKTAVDAAHNDFKFVDSVALARAGVNYRF